MLQLNNVRVSRDNREILHIKQLQIDTGKFNLILGHNGSGKSTLAKLLAGQIQADSGTVLINAKASDKYKPRELAQEIGYLPQYLPQAPGLTVAELVKLGRFPWRGILGRWRDQDRSIIDTAIAQTDLGGFTDTLVDQLSGGERQRAWIAMLLAQQAKVLILDEPTAALDLAHQYQLLKLLQKLHREQGCGVIVVLHDVNLALRFASEVLALQQGRVFYQGDVEQFADPALLSKLFNVDIVLLDHPQSADKVAVVC
ncbi:MAG: ABC transporter ATP-binding protein [Pseudomonadales bacterium]|nr:ABC transporter ATP-binding protein [Pseudomonadales bacterium]NRA16264.1 ABC transporter ATP-binding protein [Oceanospirillaceae bacterium]